MVILLKTCTLLSEAVNEMILLGKLVPIIWDQPLLLDNTFLCSLASNKTPFRSFLGPEFVVRSLDATQCNLYSPAKFSLCLEVWRILAPSIPEPSPVPPRPWPGLYGLLMLAATWVLLCFSSLPLGTTIVDKWGCLLVDCCVLLQIFAFWFFFPPQILVVFMCRFCFPLFSLVCWSIISPLNGKVSNE